MTRTEFLTDEQRAKLRNNPGFARYCVGCERRVPPEGSDDYHRLGLAYLAWSAARRQAYG